MGRADAERASIHLLKAIRILRAPVAAGDESKDDLIAAYHLSTEAAKCARQCLDNKKKCAGLYWRLDAKVAERLNSANKEEEEEKEEEPKKKRSRKMKTGTQCSAKGGMPKFDQRPSRAYGPPRTDGQSQLLCTACYETFRRDKKGGFLQ